MVRRLTGAEVDCHLGRHNLPHVLLLAVVLVVAVVAMLEIRRQAGEDQRIRECYALCGPRGVDNERGRSMPRWDGTHRCVCSDGGTPEGWE